MASKLKKMNFYGDVIFVYVELRLSWLSVINFLPDFWYVVAETILYQQNDIYF